MAKLNTSAGKGDEREMKWQIFGTLLMGILLLGAMAGIASAQIEDCPAQVYYGAGGKDEGQCLDHEEALCETKEYAVAQGRLICSKKVQVFNVLRKVETVYMPEFKHSFLDRLIIIVYWLGSTVGGVLIGYAGERWLEKIWPKSPKVQEV